MYNSPMSKKIRVTERDKILSQYAVHILKTLSGQMMLKVSFFQKILKPNLTVNTVDKMYVVALLSGQ